MYMVAMMAPRFSRALDLAAVGTAVSPFTADVTLGKHCFFLHFIGRRKMGRRKSFLGFRLEKDNSELQTGLYGPAASLKWGTVNTPRWIRADAVDSDPDEARLRHAEIETLLVLIFLHLYGIAPENVRCLALSRAMGFREGKPKRWMHSQRDCYTGDFHHRREGSRVQHRCVLVLNFA
ncbi:hypothetical protein DFH07DRAFT_210577 [Mycena maculata]|uniref:Uncharacterized protein n=1 Tax=Mycena maculata TaxID=230809 RepID=A0AAD7KG78_9AGAR|nr:hypothetical protein DFH07DRAFT_210577 [Mycena maculata]